jgi:hypothetical protein
MSGGPAIEAMDEPGLDPNRHQFKAIASPPGGKFDVAVTMG